MDVLIMARPQYFIPSGFIKKFYDRTTHERDGLFSLDRWIKKIFNRYKVAHIDDCCAADETYLPMRYNKTAGNMQYYNPTNDTWTDISAF